MHLYIFLVRKKIVSICVTIDRNRNERASKSKSHLLYSRWHYSHQLTHYKQNCFFLLTLMLSCRILIIEPNFIFYYDQLWSIHSVEHIYPGFAFWLPFGFAFWLPVSLPILQPSRCTWTPLLFELDSQWILKGRSFFLEIEAMWPTQN